MTDRQPRTGNQTYLTQWAAQLTTRSGVRLNIRPVSSDDGPLIAELLTNLTPDDLRSRFLATVGKIGADLVNQLVAVDHSHTENFLAFDADNGHLVASALIIADSSFQEAEVAVAVRSRDKHMGIGWSLLKYLIEHAASQGVRRLKTAENRGSIEAIELEREMGFKVEEKAEDRNLVLLSKDLSRA